MAVNIHDRSISALYERPTERSLNGMPFNQPDPLQDLCRTALMKLDERDLRRHLSTADPKDAAAENPLNFASNNYLGLATDSRVIEAGQAALRRWGTGAGASRLVTGNNRTQMELEDTLAEFKGTQRALLFSSGYAANVGVITALAGPRDYVLADRLSHASLIDGCRQAHAQLRLYPHRDLDRLEDMLAQVPERSRAFIVTDGVFSMDGELAPLPRLTELADQYDGILIVDDAHGTGVIGPEGKGTVAFYELEDRVPIQIGTLSKALGGQGGFVAGSTQLIDLLVNKARSFMYSTGLSPALAAASHEALRIARADSKRRKRLQNHLTVLQHHMDRLGYETYGSAPAPMISVKIGDPRSALRLGKYLKSREILAPAIRPPTVPDGTSRIRLAPMATHSSEDLEYLCQLFPPPDKINERSIPDG